MKPKTHLLYFEGCPNVAGARENLGKALGAAGYKGIEWEEVDVKGPGAHEEWKGFPSPTILVNGVNIEDGERRSSGAGTCRMGGAPSVEVIVRGLERYGRTR